MTKRVILDTGPLSRISHPQAVAKNREITEWLTRLLAADFDVIIPEIADYELRRELIRCDKKKSLARLDELRANLSFQPIDSATLLRAAEFWAIARNKHCPTADPRELDVDAILAAQAERADAIVITENIGHLSLFVPAARWQEIAID